MLAHAVKLLLTRRSRVNNLREVLTWLRCEDTCGIGRVGLLRRRDIGSWSFAKVELSKFFENLVRLLEYNGISHLANLSLYLLLLRPSDTSIPKPSKYLFDRRLYLYGEFAADRSRPVSSSFPRRHHRVHKHHCRGFDENNGKHITYYPRQIP